MSRCVIEMADNVANKSFQSFIAIVLLTAGALASSIPKDGVILVGGVPIESNAAFLSSWQLTFESYLTDVVGKKYSPPLQFSLVLLNLTSAFDILQASKVHFVFANPSLYSCLEAEFSGTEKYF